MQFLSKKIHRYAGGLRQADSASITVQFRFYHAGKETEYRVNRIWNRADAGLDERLYVHKRDSEDEQFLPLDTVDDAYWQSFIKNLIPKGVANLFFFDGEKVVEIARETKEDFAIKESFKSLLGLNMIEQLRTDLQVNLMRNLTGKNSALQDEYEKYKKEKEECTANNDRLRERLAQKQNEADDLQSQIESLEGRVSTIGGEFATARESAKASLASKRLDYTNIEKRIQENCSGCLPFSLIPARLDAVKSGIEGDQNVLQERLAYGALESELTRIKSDMGSDGFWGGLGLDKESAKGVREKVFCVIDKRMPVPGTRKSEMFGFSPSQASKILRTIEEANGSALDRLSHDTGDLAALGRDIERLEKTLASAANDDEVGPMVSELGKLNLQAGEIRAEMNHIEEGISSNTAMSAHIGSKLNGIVSQMYQDEKSETKVKLTQTVQAVLDEFLKKIKDNKLRYLEQYLLEATELLMHKRRFIERIKINPDTFGVGMFGKGGQPIPKDMLSEGEKQMFATAVLWALAKTSGRPLPFMIDTPLARLDEDHRTNIVEKFLPIASHQTVIFSTDKEIELEYYETLKPYISRSYVVEFSEGEGSAVCRDGYFWDEKGEKTVAVR